MRFAFAVLAMLVLAACTTDGSRIHYTHYGSYSGSIAQYGARTGELALSVFGNPTEAPAAAFNAAVADGFYGSHLRFRTVFVPVVPPRSTGYRTVAVFGGVTMETICRLSPEQAEGLASPASRRFAAAYCHNDSVLSFVSGEHPPIGGPRDPALRAFLQRIGYELFPPENPNHFDKDKTFLSKFPVRTL